MLFELSFKLLPLEFRLFLRQVLLGLDGKGYRQRLKCSLGGTIGG